jgi:hypothetical protein
VKGLFDFTVLAAEGVDLSRQTADFLTRLRHPFGQRFDLRRQRLLLLDERGFGAGRQFEFVFDR